jgi:para-aminobenzoate synthetase component I
MRRVPGLYGLSAVEVANRLRHLGGLVFFDTAGNVPEKSGRPVSVIAAAPVRMHQGSIFKETDLGMLREVMAANACVGGDHGFPDGGLCGWVDYEGGFVFGEYPEMLIKDEATGDWWERGCLSVKLRDPEECPVVVGDFREVMGREHFLESVRRVQEWIAAGDIYQVNIAQAFSAEVSGEGSLFGLYETLREASPAPMGAWMELDGKEVLSTSPELFLRISGDGIETRPIKGTRPRFADPDEDRRSAVELQTSPKEAAELVMITDLLRNDLGRVCEFGSVEVTRMLQLESLAQVHHLVSTVQGTLRETEDALSALSACFPGGSITGAPKKRAMEIISELEGMPRGIYCGAIGWLGFNGESQFNIAIRTLVREGENLRYHVGAGIVADSIPEHEYAETMQKGEGIRIGVEKFRSACRKVRA